MWLGRDGVAVHDLILQGGWRSIPSVPEHLVNLDVGSCRGLNSFLSLPGLLSVLSTGCLAVSASASGVPTPQPFMNQLQAAKHPTLSNDPSSMACHSYTILCKPPTFVICPLGLNFVAHPLDPWADCTVLLPELAFVLPSPAAQTCPHTWLISCPQRCLLRHGIGRFCVCHLQTCQSWGLVIHRVH